eukprot:s657_g25.t1
MRGVGPANESRIKDEGKPSNVGLREIAQKSEALLLSVKSGDAGLDTGVYEATIKALEKVLWLVPSILTPYLQGSRSPGVGSVALDVELVFRQLPIGTSRLYAIQ